MSTETRAAMKVDVAVIGGGPAGMSAAAAAKEAGAEKVLIIERDTRLGGILDQCIHNGFGLHKFKEELTGPEYAERYEQLIKDLHIPFMVNTMVIDIFAEEPREKDDEKGHGGQKIITAVNKERGYFRIEAAALVLAMGCRERPRGALRIPGSRPAGIITAGTAQKLVNIKGYMPGKKIVILGSGDIGLIMARRMTLEGAEVKAVCEIMADSGGLTRNIVQCLNDYNIPLRLRHTVVKIHGKERLEGVTIARVDDELKPASGSEEYIECDTLMLSVGLIPENELSKKAGVEIDSRSRGPIVDKNRQTNVSGIFACGNVVKVHELVDYVSDEGEVAGKSAALYAQGRELPSTDCDEKENAVHEQKKGVKHLSVGDEQVVICTICPMGCKVSVEEALAPGKAPAQGDCGDGVSYKTCGNRCKRGEKYAIQEITAPERTLTTTMAAKRAMTAERTMAATTAMAADGQEEVMVPVKTDRPVPKEKFKQCLKEINCKTLLLPICQGDIIIKNIGGTGADLIATRTFAD